MYDIGFSLFLKLRLLCLVLGDGFGVVGRSRVGCSGVGLVDGDRVIGNKRDSGRDSCVDGSAVSNILSSDVGADGSDSLPQNEYLGEFSRKVYIHFAETFSKVVQTEYQIELLVYFIGLYEVA